MKVISQFFREDLDSIPRHERGFRFVFRPLQDLHDLLDDPDLHVAAPQEVHPRGAPPEETLLAYPVLEGPWASDLAQALRIWVRENTVAAVDERQGSPRDRRRLAKVRGSLAREIDRCLDSCTYSSQGRFLSSIFWLWLSVHTSQELGRVSGLVLERNRSLAGLEADRIKYAVFQRLSVLLHEVNLEVNRRVVGEVGRRSGELLSRLVLNMRDNVLIFTEEYIDPELTRLHSYLAGSQGLEPRAFLDRLRRTRDFAVHIARKDRIMRQAILSFYGLEPEEVEGDRLFFEDRFTELVFQHPKYSRRKYLNREQRRVFRDLSAKLRGFELLHLLRRRILRARERPDGFLQAKTGGRWIILSRETSALDFSKPGAMENLVWRNGLMYDIRDFTATLERLRRQGTEREKVAIKHMFLLHELLYELQEEHHLTLEKFLGDGAFYTGLSPVGLVLSAVAIQNLYSDLRRRGFVFDAGIRIALNYAYYNLLPIRGAEGSGRGEYLLEYHGPGLVELNRLTTGKARAEIRELKEMLVNHGYDSSSVHSFFAPMERETRTGPQKGEFGAFLDEHGVLINEGIVASRPFVERLSEDLGKEAELTEIELRHHPFIGWSSNGRWFGVRELGTAHLKGLEPQRVYEIDSLEGSAAHEGTPVPAGRLLPALDVAFRKAHDAGS